MLGQARGQFLFSEGFKKQICRIADCECKVNTSTLRWRNSPRFSARRDCDSSCAPEEKERHFFATKKIYLKLLRHQISFRFLSLTKSARCLSQLCYLSILTLGGLQNCQKQNDIESCYCTFNSVTTGPAVKAS